MDLEAISIAMANEKTIPMLANVRSMPEAMPNTDGGLAFITAELLAGKNALAPIPLTTLARTTSHSPDVSDRRAYSSSEITWIASPAVAGITGPALSASRPANGPIAEPPT